MTLVNELHGLLMVVPSRQLQLCQVMGGSCQTKDHKKVDLGLAKAVSVKKWKVVREARAERCENEPKVVPMKAAFV